MKNCLKRFKISNKTKRKIIQFVTKLLKYQEPLIPEVKKQYDLVKIEASLAMGYPTYQKVSTSTTKEIIKQKLAKRVLSHLKINYKQKEQHEIIIMFAETHIVSLNSQKK